MNWDQIAEAYRAVAEEVFVRMQKDVTVAAENMASCIRNGGKVMACGNGGSAADAQHFAGELVNRFLLERRPYAGLALTTDSSVLSSIGNDCGYEEVFEKQVQALGRKGDVLLAISTSGNAENVCRAVCTARETGIVTIGMTGGTGGRLSGLVDQLLCVSCTASVPRIQEGHQLLIHLFCEQMEEMLK